jgi:hypothetical protein
MNDDIAVTAANFRAVRLKDCMAALDLMLAKTQQTLAELEPCARHEHEHARPEPSGILQMYVSRLDQSAETRCRNLRSTMRAIERERHRAQNELSAVLQVDES